MRKQERCSCASGTICRQKRREVLASFRLDRDHRFTLHRLIVTLIAVVVFLVVTLDKAYGQDASEAASVKSENPNSIPSQLALNSVLATGVQDSLEASLDAPVLGRASGQYRCGYQVPEQAIRAIQDAVASGEIADPTIPLLPPTTGKLSLAQLDGGCIPIVTRSDIFAFEDSAGVLQTNYSTGQRQNLMTNAANALISAKGDNFDFIGFWLNSAPNHQSSTAFYWTVFNDTTGIGLSFFNYRGSLGLASNRVQGYVMMWNINTSYWQPGTGSNADFTRLVLGQEFEHRFGMFLPAISGGRQLQGDNGSCGRSAHWNYKVDGQGSCMEISEWVGTTSLCRLGGILNFNTDTGGVFSFTDLYLMGYVSPAEMDAGNSELRYLDNNTDCSSPYTGVTTTFSSADIIATAGVRTPDSVVSQKNYRTAWIMIHQPGSPPTDAELDKTTGILNMWTDTWHDSTLGRGTMNNSLRAGCDDGVFCNGLETCDIPTRTCQVGSSPCGETGCDEGIDTCLVACTSNQHCDDSLFCNGLEVCDVQSGICESGIAPDCDDSISCTDDICNEVEDFCENIANNDNCADDGLFCNGIEYCDEAADCVSTNDMCDGNVCDEVNATCLCYGTMTTGFEAEDGFSLGHLRDQACWSTFLSSLEEAQVSDVNPAVGFQHLRISLDPALSQGRLVGAFSPDIGPLPAGPSTTFVDIAISASGGADYSLSGQSPSEGYAAWKVRFNDAGTIDVLDKLGCAFQYVDTGVAWAVGSYKRLTVCDNPEAGTTAYYYDGALIYSQIERVTGTRVEQVVMYSDNYQITDVGDFDNLSVEYGLSGLCAGGCGSDGDCDDLIACTLDTCNPVTGCENTPINSGCEDSNVCTTDICDTVTGCKNDGTGVTVTCGDGDVCTIDDVCQGDADGTCVGEFQDSDADSVCDANDNCVGDQTLVDLPCDSSDDADDCETGIYDCSTGTLVCTDDAASDDADADGVCDLDDNCPTIENPQQEDCNEDGVGDVCTVPAAPEVEFAGVSKERFVSLVVPAEGACNSTALQVTLNRLYIPGDPLPVDPPDFSAREGEVRYVNLLRDEFDVPVTSCLSSSSFVTFYRCATVGCEPEYLDWAGLFGGETIHVSGSSIVPDSTYTIVQLAPSCNGNETACTAVSESLQLATARHGDVDANGFVNVTDIVLTVDVVKDVLGAVWEYQCYVRNESPEPHNDSTNVTDIVLHVDAVKLTAYAFDVPSCP
jgi:hypothetical protein